MQIHVGMFAWDFRSEGVSHNFDSNIKANYHNSNLK